MLEYKRFTRIHDGDVDVEANLNGEPVKFCITREAINDFLQVHDRKENTDERLKEHWGKFEPELERILTKNYHSRPILIDSDTLNP